jgi:hypothetical protein
MTILGKKKTNKKIKKTCGKTKARLSASSILKK